MELLQRTLELIPPEVCVILDAKRGDIGSTAAAYAQACFADPRVDAVTVSPYLGRDSLEPFFQQHERGVFVLCHTSNPGAADLQELEISDWRTLDREPNQPLYIHIARQAPTWSPNVGLVVGATFPDAVAACAPGGAGCLVPCARRRRAGRRSRGDGHGRAAGGWPGNHRQRQPGHRRRSGPRSGRGGTARRHQPSCVNGPRDRAPERAAVPVPAVIAGLVELEAVKFGDFTLASGIHSPIYIDLRLLVSEPALLAQVAEQYAALLSGLPYDRIAGVPYAALPIATAVSLSTGMPMIYPRKEVKAHGLGKEIEGGWQPGERVVIVEDLITSGGSTIATAERLRAAGSGRASTSSS